MDAGSLIAAGSAPTLMAVGSGLQVGGKIGQGMAAQDQSNFAAAAYERSAAGERAAGGRAGMERDADTARVLGHQRAVAAASGGGVSNPTIADIMGDTAARGAYLKATDIYAGNERARADLDKAAAAKAAGKNVFTGALLDAGSSALIGAAKFKKTYGSGGGYDPSWSDTTTLWG